MRWGGLKHHPSPSRCLFTVEFFPGTTDPRSISLFRLSQSLLFHGILYIPLCRPRVMGKVEIPIKKRFPV